jgi:DivIVA domain-containing protein
MTADDDLTPGERIWKEAVLRDRKGDRKLTRSLSRSSLLHRGELRKEEKELLPKIRAEEAEEAAKPFTAGGFGWEAVFYARFAKARGPKGYANTEVEAFLGRVADALNDPPEGTVTPEEVHDVTFPEAGTLIPGLDYVEVDAFLDLVEEQLRARQAGTTPARAGFSSPEKRHAQPPQSQGT